MICPATREECSRDCAEPECVQLDRQFQAGFAALQSFRRRFEEPMEDPVFCVAVHLVGCNGPCYHPILPPEKSPGGDQLFNAMDEIKSLLADATDRVCGQEVEIQVKVVRMERAAYAAMPEFDGY